jgi:hypothetical protein
MIDKRTKWIFGWVAVLILCNSEQGCAFSRIHNKQNTLGKTSRLSLRGGMFGARPKLTPQPTFAVEEGQNQSIPNSPAAAAAMDPKLIAPMVSRGQMLRATSYSLLDEAHVTEPGMALTDASGADTGAENRTMVETISFEVNRHSTFKLCSSLASALS